jgi:hypothetical protein
MIFPFMQIAPKEQDEYRKAVLAAQIEAMVRALARSAARERFVNTRPDLEIPGRHQSP